jgi:tetratricopeptide (TPR) repeat protein
MDKKLAALVIGLFLVSCLFAQDPKWYYDHGLEAAQKGELNLALALLDTSIMLKPDEYVAWYNRGIVKTMMGNYDAALPDLEETIKLNEGYKKGYLNRGNVKKHLTDYTGALSDYTLATLLDSTYGEAFYDRGIVYEMFGKTDLACADYQKAWLYKFAPAEAKAGICTSGAIYKKETHALLYLTRTASNYKYGFTSELPVEVGTGPEEGDLSNERVYLGLLRDAKGNPVQYQHIGTCCGYSSVNAPKGLALVDKYQLTFVNDAGEQRQAIVYLSLYDYSEPLILYGFKTVGTK